MNQSSSLFLRLFRWREKANRGPLENFLTEALADLLGRLPRPELTDAVARLFLPAPDKGNSVDPEWLKGVRAEYQYRWTTQKRTPEGIPDLLLEVQEQPVLIVEVKVDSRIGRSARLNSTGSASDTDLVTPVGEDQQLARALDQLDKYQNWLISQPQKFGTPALVLLSRKTEQPERLRLKNLQAEEVNMYWRHCRWHEVWNWLRQIAAPAVGDYADNAQVPAWRVLAVELQMFLQEMNMAVGTMTSRDLAAAEELAPGDERIRASFDQIGKAACVHIEALTQGNITFEYHRDGAMVGWIYLREPRNWTVGWGIRFPTGPDWWTIASNPLPDVTFVFVYLNAERAGPRPHVNALSSDELPNSWYVAEAELVAVRRLNEFPDEPDARTSELANWIGERVGELVKLLPRVKPPG